MIEELSEEEKRFNHIQILVDKLDNICDGYQKNDMSAALMTLMRRLAINAHKTQNMEIEFILDKITEGLRESIKIQLDKEKEILN